MPISGPFRDVLYDLDKEDVCAQAGQLVEQVEESDDKESTVGEPTVPDAGRKQAPLRSCRRWPALGEPPNCTPFPTLPFTGQLGVDHCAMRSIKQPAITVSSPCSP